MQWLRGARGGLAAALGVLAIAVPVVVVQTAPGARAQGPQGPGSTASIPEDTSTSVAPEPGRTTTTTTPEATAPGTTSPTTTGAEASRRATTTTPRPGRTSTTTTTTVPVRASGTWITAPGYNPEWHSINPPWLPRPPAGSGNGRRIVYAKGQQRVWLMEDNGYIAKTHLVSGRYDIPAYGWYSVYSKSRYTFATHNPSITWEYMVRFAVGPRGGAIGLHQIPVRNGVPMQSEAQLGQPLSGGCLRQAAADAIFVWNWAPIGTPVVVVP